MAHIAELLGVVVDLVRPVDRVATQARDGVLALAGGTLAVEVGLHVLGRSRVVRRHLVVTGHDGVEPHVGLGDLGGARVDLDRGARVVGHDGREAS